MGVSFFGIVFLAMVIGSFVVLGPGLVSALIAHRKGYRPWFWILSFGLLGLLVTILIPGLRTAETPEQRERWETRADWAGGILSALTFMSMFLLPVMGGLFFVGVSAPMRMPAIPVPPPTTVPTMVLEEQETVAEEMKEPAGTEEQQPGSKSE